MSDRRSESIHAEGDVALAGPPGAASRFAVRWTDVDLNRATESLGYAPPVRIGARGSGSANLRFTGLPDLSSLSHLDAELSAALRPEGIGLSLEGALDLAVRQGAWSLEHRVASAPAGASIAGTLRGRLDTRALESTLGGATTLRVADLGRLVPLLQQTGVTLPAQLAADLSGRLDATATLNGTTARPAVRCHDHRARGAGGGPAGRRRGCRAHRHPRRAARADGGNPAGRDAAAGVRFIRLERPRRRAVRRGGRRSRRAGTRVRVVGRAGRGIGAPGGTCLGHAGVTASRRDARRARPVDRRGGRRRDRRVAGAGRRPAEVRGVGAGAGHHDAGRPADARALRVPGRSSASTGRSSMRSSRLDCAHRSPSRRAASPAPSARTARSTSPWR